MGRLLLVLLLLLVSAPGARAETAVAGALRIQAEGEGARVRLALSGSPGAPTHFALDAPMRLVIDLPDTSSLRRDSPGAGPIRAARVGQFDAGTVRIVLDLARPMRLASARFGSDRVLELRLDPVAPAAWPGLVRGGRAGAPGFLPEAAPTSALPADSAKRLEDVERALASVEAQLGRSPPRAEQSPPAKPAPPGTGAPPEPGPPIRSTRPRSKGAFLVVLDPGHGGRDPGAPSAIGGTEKAVTLAIAKAAKRAIERRARAEGVAVRVRLTREDDRFITLANRVRLARDWGADLFISIHADSAPNADARGASIYTLSDTASDREAARLAAKENRADVIAGVDLSREDREVAGILIDLEMRDSMNASAGFAQLLQQRMAASGVPFRTSFHRFAGFQVLKNLGIPAVLLETGFLSNTADAGYLASDRGEAAIAAGIADAAVGYFASR